MKGDVLFLYGESELQPPKRRSGSSSPPFRRREPLKPHPRASCIRFQRILTKSTISCLTGLWLGLGI